MFLAVHISKVSEYPRYEEPPLQIYLKWFMII